MVAYIYKCGWVYLSETILNCSDDSQIVWKMFMFCDRCSGLLGLTCCVYGCVSACASVFLQVCVWEFLKAKSWHFAQHVGWGKNTTRIYSSLLSCHRQVACVCVCMCVYYRPAVYVCQLCVWVSVCACGVRKPQLFRGLCLAEGLLWAAHLHWTGALNSAEQHSWRSTLVQHHVVFYYTISSTVNTERNKTKLRQKQRIAKLHFFLFCQAGANRATKLQDLSDAWKWFRWMTTMETKPVVFQGVWSILLVHPPTVCLYF